MIDEGVTVAELCRKENPKLFSKYQGQILDVLKNSLFSFFIIQDVIVGERIFLKDIILQKEVVVKENLGTKFLKKGEIIFCRPVTIDQQSIIVGFFPHSIPNRFFDKIISFRQGLLKESMLTQKSLIDLDRNLRELYFTILEEAFRPIHFSNADNDALILNDIFYDLKCTPFQIFKLLSMLLPINHKVSWRERVRDEKGNFIEINLSWFEFIKSSKKTKGTDKLLGNFTITPKELKVFVNSNERAFRVMEMIEIVLKNNVVFREKKEINISTSEHFEKVDKKSLGIKPLSINESAEQEAFLKEHLAKYWENWLDTKIPLLGNSTPRKAVKSKLGREKLEALFLDFENINMVNLTHGDNLNQIDIKFLKRELAML